MRRPWKPHGPTGRRDTVDGVADNGNLDQSIQWKCRYEDALVQPNRPVLDVHMGQYLKNRALTM